MLLLLLCDYVKLLLYDYVKLRKRLRYVLKTVDLNLKQFYADKNGYVPNDSYSSKIKVSFLVCGVLATAKMFSNNKQQKI